MLLFCVWMYEKICLSCFSWMRWKMPATEHLLPWKGVEENRCQHIRWIIVCICSPLCVCIFRKRCRLYFSWWRRPVSSAMGGSRVEPRFNLSWNFHLPTATVIIAIFYEKYFDSIINDIHLLKDVIFAENHTDLHFCKERYFWKHLCKGCTKLLKVVTICSSYFDERTKSSTSQFSDSEM